MIGYDSKKARPSPAYFALNIGEISRIHREKNRINAQVVRGITQIARTFATGSFIIKTPELS